MENNNLQSNDNKTELFQFRVSHEVKQKGRSIANKYFRGNMSVMFRYLLYHFDFKDGNTPTDVNNDGNNFTSDNGKEVELLTDIHEEYLRQNRELSAIGNNVNQIAYHTNAQARRSPSPVTDKAADGIDGINTSLKSMRATNGSAWKWIKERAGFKKD